MKRIKEIIRVTKFKFYFWLYNFFKKMTEEQLRNMIEEYSEDPYHNYYFFKSYSDDKKQIENFLKGLLVQSYSNIYEEDIELVHEIKLHIISQLIENYNQYFERNNIRSLHNNKHSKIQLQFLYIYKVKKDVLHRLG